MFFTKKEVSVKINNINKVFRTLSRKNLYQFLIDENIVNHTLCKGSGQCGKCKILFIGKNVPSPSYKDKLILADINVSNDYRLACQHSIKSDIEIDLLDMSLAENITPHGDDSKNTISTNSNTSINLNNNDDFPLIDDYPTHYTDEIPEPLIDHSTSSVTDGKRSSGGTKERPDDTKYEGVSDCIILIQQRKSIRYYCYSAALDTIFMEGSTKTEEKLTTLIQNNFVPDFIHNVLNVKNIDRILIVTEKFHVDNTETFMDMINYTRFEIGTMLCEVVMPYKDNHDIIRFFRLLSSDSNNKLIISLDMLDKIYFLNAKNITELASNKLSTINISSIFPVGKNPILSFNSDLSIRSVLKQEFSADSLTLASMLELISIMKNEGLIDSKFKLKNRTELLENKIDLTTALKLIGSDIPTGFYIHRERSSEIILTQAQLDQVYQIRSHILSVIEWTGLNILKLSNIVFLTTEHFEGLIDSMITLGFIPKDYQDKIIYSSGDSRVQAINIFKERDFSIFLKERFRSCSNILLDDDKSFQDIQKTSNN